MDDRHNPEWATEEEAHENFIDSTLPHKPTPKHEHIHTIDAEGHPVCVYCGERLEL